MENRFKLRPFTQEDRLRFPNVHPFHDGSAPIVWQCDGGVTILGTDSLLVIAHEQEMWCFETIFSDPEFYLDTIPHRLLSVFDIDEFRRVLNDVRRSPIPWLFAAGGTHLEYVHEQRMIL